VKSLLLHLILAVMPFVAAAEEIVFVPDTTRGGGLGFYGQSFTTPGGGPWAEIAFNFFGGRIGFNVAAGDAFLLTQEYVGTASELSSAAPGFLAESTGISDPGTIRAMYVFSPSVVLHPGVEYWLYENASISANSSPTSIAGTPAMHAYFAGTSTSRFSALGGGGETFGFSLQGSIIPEPATLACTSSGFFVLLMIWRIRHTVSGIISG